MGRNYSVVVAFCKWNLTVSWFIDSSGQVALSVWSATCRNHRKMSREMTQRYVNDFIIQNPNCFQKSSIFECVHNLLSRVDLHIKVGIRLGCALAITFRLIDWMDLVFTLVLLSQEPFLSRLTQFIRPNRLIRPLRIQQWCFCCHQFSGWLDTSPKKCDCLGEPFAPICHFKHSWAEGCYTQWLHKPFLSHWEGHCAK